MFEKLKKGPTDDKSTNPRIGMPWTGRQWDISHFPLSSPENHLKVVEENHTHWKKLKNFRNNWESCCSLLSLIRYQKTPFARKYLKPENVYKALCVAMLHVGFVSKKLDWKILKLRKTSFLRLTLEYQKHELLNTFKFTRTISVLYWFMFNVQLRRWFE